MINKTIFNRAPLASNELAALPLGAIRPQQWLKEQLERAASGLTGRLDDFWPSVKDSAWRGGKGDGWERAPYYLDGLIPLAWLLGDAHLKEKAMRYIEWTLKSQREDGFFGPADNEDWWPRMVMLKALIQYYTATADARVPEFMFRYFKYQYRTLDEKPLRDWAVPRGAENIEAVVWLYNLTGSKFLLSLMKRLRAQTLDWTAHFHAFPYTRSMSEILPWDELKAGLAKENSPLSGQDRPYYATQYHLSHVVNTAMGLRAGAIMSQFTDSAHDREAFVLGYDRLMRYHGVASGMFNGDEHLSGNAPTQGAELCAVAEMMYSCELLPTTGADWSGAGDILEKLAFNALPAAISADMMAHQYDQQVNQISCTVEKRPWYNNADDSNIFGLEPNYGCCTANMHQAWPKYAASLWYATRDEGFYCMSGAPCTVAFFSGDVPVRINVETCYPFERTVKISVSPARPKAFPLRVRIPAWANGALGALVNGGEHEGGIKDDCLEINRVWQNGDSVTLIYPMEARVTRWSRRSAAVEYGPLLMAMPIRAAEKCIREDPIAPDYEARPQSRWNFALVAGGKLEYVPSRRESGFGAGEGPCVLARAVELPGWKTRGTNCAPTPVEPAIAESHTHEVCLVPYGDTVLRIAQFPYAALGRDLGVESDALPAETVRHMAALIKKQLEMNDEANRS